MKINSFIIACACALVLFACKKNDDPTQEELGYSYYPINEGDYRIYDVIDTSFEGVGNTVISQYQIKEEVREPLTVNDETRYQLYLYYKYPGDTDWKSYPDSVWTVFRSGARIIKVENNIRYVKLVFPFEVDKKWDGNISDPNSDPQQYYTMKEVRRPFSYDTYSYSKTVSVVEFDNSSALDNNYSVEVFAEDQGLVYKDKRIYKYDQSNLINKVIEYGDHYVQKLTAHGRYK